MVTPPELLKATLADAREQEYTGWDRADGMSSRVLQELPVDNKWLNLVVQESIKRAPVNIRPLLLVEQRRSFLGTALFVVANRRAYEYTGDDRYEREARRLADWLVDNSSPRTEKFAGYHAHDLQKLHRKGISGTPGVVSTSYGVNALLTVADVDDRYAETARTAAEFVFEDLDYQEFEDGARINYTPKDRSDVYTLNANAIGARLLVDLYDYFGTDEYREAAEKILTYVASRQEPEGGWKYRDPPSESHLSMDNFHNGYIIESMLRFREVTESDQFDPTIDRSLRFYEETLFDPDGTPNHDESSPYPKDIHDVAQGIIVFSMVGDFDQAERILRWGVENLYGGDGQFYQEKRRFYTKRIVLMRWCQAWMAMALGTYLHRRIEA